MKGLTNLIELYSKQAGASLVLLVKFDGLENSVVSAFPESKFKEGELKKIFNESLKKVEFNTLDKLLANKNVKKCLEQQGFDQFRIDNICSDSDNNFELITFHDKDQESGVSSDNLELIKKSIAEFVQLQTEVKKKYIEPTSNINSVIYSTNATGSEYHFISESVKNIFGLQPDEIIKNRIKLLRTIQPEYFPDYNKFIKKLKKGEKASTEYKIVDLNGRRRFVRHYGFPILANGKVVRVVGVIEDITEEKNVFYRLEKAEEKFKMLLETSKELIISLDSFGYVSHVNKNGAKSLGQTPGEIIGKHFLELIEEKNKNEIANAFQKILSSEDQTNFEAMLVDKFEHEIVFEFIATPVSDEGVISGMVVVGQDVTKSRENEEKIKELNNKLVEANRIISIERDRAKQQITVLEEINKLKNDFISRVSHEFRTPLASIVGFAETLTSDEDLPEDMVAEFSTIILTEGKRLAKLINDVLDFSKVDAEDAKLNRTNIDIVSLLKKQIETFEIQAKEKLITLTKEIPEAEILIHADSEMVAKALSCIIENAIKFTNKDGRISIIAQDFLKEVEIAVNDTGVGISEEDIPHLFEKFSKFETNGLQSNGPGLGLAFVKRVVDLHHGLIQVKSELNKGSSFIIRLPKKK